MKDFILQNFANIALFLFSLLAYQGALAQSAADKLEVGNYAITGSFQTIKTQLESIAINWETRFIVINNIAYQIIEGGSNFKQNCTEVKFMNRKLMIFFKNGRYTGHKFTNI